MRLVFLSLIATASLFFSCNTDNDESADYQYEAIVQGKGLDCGETYIISLIGLSENAPIADGIYYADQLDSIFKISGLEILLNCREPLEAEQYACTSMGPAYLHIVVTDCMVK